MPNCEKEAKLDQEGPVLNGVIAPLTAVLSAGDGWTRFRANPQIRGWSSQIEVTTAELFLTNKRSADHDCDVIHH